ncbi:probable long-chain-alcohol O-fatty-acyltransferase 5 [Salvia hispanica]|uniref:probable long-chain-alcohol O-fatty-acyltransferase 5 n=1 Tax=Salvia hispanica TaxID=49212 RepID=UPI002009C609|nr:probable long-chain-alcohol O-fatty-acyltransferase 5 [Salvia hispanica]
MLNNQMEGEIKKIAYVWLSAVAALSYSRLVSAKLPKGKWRLISIIPVLFLFAILPLHTPSAFIRALTAFFLTWLTSFKLLLFSFDSGPLHSDPPKSLPVFIAVATLPFTLAAAPRKPPKLPLNLPAQIAIAALLVSLLFEQRRNLHPVAVMLLYCLLLFLMIEILVGLSSKVVWALLGEELQSPSDEPYLAASLREFWGRRWNLTVNSILREAVFQPVRSLVGGGQAGPMIGVLASFAVSGIMHELLFWYLTPGARPTWEMTAFFVLHGVCVVAEFAGKGRWRLPGFVTVAFVIGTSFWLFFPPVMRNGADVRVIEEIRFAGELLLNFLFSFTT